MAGDSYLVYSADSVDAIVGELVVTWECSGAYAW